MYQNNAALSEIKSEVLGYLEEHPDAADSVEAIQQWWLLQRVSRFSHERIQKVLDQLVEAHLVERLRLSDGHEVYKRAHQSHLIN
jgi:Fe2+ or Zn2+ uptake regulation protein